MLKHELNTIYYLHCAYQDSVKLRVAREESGVIDSVKLSENKNNNIECHVNQSREVNGSVLTQEHLLFQYIEV